MKDCDGEIVENPHGGGGGGRDHVDREESTYQRKGAGQSFYTSDGEGREGGELGRIPDPVQGRWGGRLVKEGCLRSTIRLGGKK